MKRISFLLALVLLAVPAAAEKPAPELTGKLQMNRDGSVVVDGELYGSMMQYQLSHRFREEGRRCATPEVDEILTYFVEKAASDCTMSSTTIRSQFDPANGSVYRIPVVFHVIQRTDGTGNVSNSLVQSQIAVLNEDFRAIAGSLGAGGTDTKIEFYLATTDPSGNATTGITRTTSNAYFTDPGPGAANDMKQALNWDPTRYLNVYSNDAAGNLGYATFPQQDAGSYQDGVVLLWSSVGRDAPQGGIYDKGRTGTHEVGHYLGLFHTFQGGCGTASAPYTTGDLISDTERQQSANFDCPANASSCSSRDPIENYMNYTQDTCMDRFTAEQANRMRCAIDAYRATLVGGGGGGGGTNVLENGVPKTGISGSQGSETRYTMSVPSGASNLVFQTSGGTGDADLYVRFGSAPTTSSYNCRPYLNGNNETCSFASPSAGTWHVMLRAYTTYSGVTLVGSYSTAAPNNPPTANFTFTTSDLTANFTNTSTDSDGTIVSRSWSFGDGGTSTATNPSRTYAAAGTYTVTLTVTDDDGATDSESKSVTVTAPPGGGAPCTGCDHFTGSLSGSGDWDAVPNGSYYYSSSSGVHEGWLEGPSSGTDFDLYLYKWVNGNWSKVAQSISSSSDEHIAYSGTAGYYYWRVTSYSGSGSYDVWIDHP